MEPDAIMVHTYCPKNSIIPQRGKDVVRETTRMLSWYPHCPIIFSVGNTVPGEKRTEAEIYRDYFLSRYPQASIIVGADKEARDSAGEIKEADHICRERGFNRVTIIALKPHLVFRLKKYWKKTNSNNWYKFTFSYPDDYQRRYWVWEFCMLILEKFLPPGSKRRHFVLNLAGRKG
jgi:hypothetical protein